MMMAKVGETPYTHDDLVAICEAMQAATVLSAFLGAAFGLQQEPPPVTAMLACSSDGPAPTAARWSARVEGGPVHDRVLVWIDGKKVGELVVGTGEGAAVAELLNGLSAGRVAP